MNTLASKLESAAAELRQAAKELQDVAAALDESAERSNTIEQVFRLRTVKIAKMEEDIKALQETVQILIKKMKHE